ncbi:hypothetical protein XENTR_v10016315 [Xenopus tropicalis]|nr:hypothetical protein XENTR_v10016315 [Xenopus tropicalis]
MFIMRELGSSLIKGMQRTCTGTELLLATINFFQLYCFSLGGENKLHKMWEKHKMGRQKKGLLWIKSINLHRNKCKALLKPVSGSVVHQELIEDIGSETYSLVIGNSTDILTGKELCIVTRYYSNIL